jgi:proteasome accessory factor C
MADRDGRHPMTDVRTPRRRGPRPANVRLRRLLVMLPWLMERGEVPLADMARRFGLTENELIADLELASLCGLPPFVDELIDVFVDEGTVYAGEAELRVELSAPPGSDDLAAAAAAGEVLLIRYWSASRETTTDRRIAPRGVFSDRGHWYLLADDLDLLHAGADAERTFRIDRIEGADRTGERVAQREATPPTEWFADDTVTTTRLRLAPQAMWAVERYPVRSVTANATGGADVELPVASERWLARLLLRLGPHAEVLEPPEWQALGAETAAAVLARYG